MYRQIYKCTNKTLKKHYGGGGAIATPAMPPLATLVDMINNQINFEGFMYTMIHLSSLLIFCSIFLKYS